MVAIITFRFQQYQAVGCSEGWEIRNGTKNSTLRLSFLSWLLFQSSTKPASPCLKPYDLWLLLPLLPLLSRYGAQGCLPLQS